MMCSLAWWLEHQTSDQEARVRSPMNFFCMRAVYDEYDQQKIGRPRAAGFEPGPPGCEADAEPIGLESLCMLSTMNVLLIFASI